MIECTVNIACKDFYGANGREIIGGKGYAG